MAGDGRADCQGTARPRETRPQPGGPGKRGAKHRALTDCGGIPLGRAIDGAHRPGVELAEGSLWSIPIPRPAPTAEQPQHLCLDKGYDADEVSRLLHVGYTPHICARGEEAQQLKRGVGAKARRWVVERTHS